MAHTRTLLLAAALAQGLAIVAPYAQERAAASQFNATTVNDQINMDVLAAISKEIGNSFTRSCTDNNVNHPHGSRWLGTCDTNVFTAGQVTYTCISGIIVLQESTCK